jgi:hypothetical protein
MSNFKWIAVIAGILLLLVADFIITKKIYYRKPVKPIVQTVTMPAIILPAKIETLKVGVPIPYWVEGRTDTLYLKDSSGNQLTEQVAKADTMIITAGQDTIGVSARYYFPPSNYFELNVNPIFKSRIDTMIISKSLNWYEHIKFGIGTGGYINFKGKAGLGVLAGIFYTF